MNEPSPSLRNYQRARAQLGSFAPLPVYWCLCFSLHQDFARRLNSDWPERVQELLSLGQERRPSLYSINGNGCSTKRSSMYAFLISSRLFFCFLFLQFLII
ncbi:hypothetical protein HanPI659440_Chr04g0175371 [Helianthus annuus]|nr:hypothetical protein HanPI659440_Chr04g0175371 [Helianthus annuus]